MSQSLGQVYPDQAFYIEGHFIDPATGAHRDPTTVTFTRKPPGGVATSYVYGVAAEVTRVSEGVYRYLVQAAAPLGEWGWQWDGDGVVDTVIVGTYEVIATTV